MHNSSKTPNWYWFLAVVVVLWNTLGVMTYLADVTINSEALAALPEARRLSIINAPEWLRAANGGVVFGGLLGGVLLLLRYKLATAAFIITLLALLVKIFHSVFMTYTYETLSPFIIVMPLMLVFFASGLIWFSVIATRQGWLN